MRSPTPMSDGELARMVRRGELVQLQQRAFARR
jgi:hypothetical protein